MSRLWNIAIIGADTTVGEQLIECLEEREFPAARVKFLVSAGNPGIGEALEFAGKAVLVEELEPGCFDSTDVAFFAADQECSRTYCPLAHKSGTVCIDLSGAWTSDRQVPLVVPEVTPEALAGYSVKGIIASPDPMALQLAVVLKPLHDFGSIKRVVVSTYQAVSGNGKPAIEELHTQVVELLNARSPESDVYPHRIAFNCLPQVGEFRNNGYSEQESLLVDQTRRIMGADFGIAATAVLVPVFYGHSASLNIESESKITAEKAMELIGRAPGCELVDDVLDQRYPMALDAAGQDQVLVGRIREDRTIPNGLNLWVVADNVRKGAATNAVQIAEILIQQYLK